MSTIMLDLGERDESAASMEHALEAFKTFVRSRLVERERGAPRATPELPAVLPEPLARIQLRLGLRDVEAWLLLCALAPAYDLEIACLYGMLCGLEQPCGLTESVLAQLEGTSLFGVRRAHPVLRGEGALLNLGLVRWEGEALVESMALRGMLFERAVLPASWASFARLHRGVAAEPILNPDDRRRFEVVCRRWATDALVPLTLVTGPRGVGKTLVARHLARAAGCDLLAVDVERLPADFDPMALVREALWLGAALCLDVSDEAQTRWSHAMARMLEHDVPLIVTSLPETLWQTPCVGDTVALALTRPTHETRHALWERHLPRPLRDAALDVATLAFRFRGCGHAIASMAREAIAHARLERPEARPVRVTDADLNAVVYERFTRRLSQMSEICPPHPEGLDAVVLPESHRSQLESVIQRITHRQRVLSEWRFEQAGYGLGVVVLLSGPPGTGKTWSARAVASALRIPLFVVNLSRIVSKWVGETEKNLETCFEEAEASGAALLFDEADALFSRRTEVKGANDQYANQAISYLLQRVEAFSGLCFLTTNMTRSIDPAFTRRLAAHLEFALPTREERAQIWRKVLPGAAPVAETVDIDRLAEAFDSVSGAQIRNAALRAAYLAAAVQPAERPHPAITMRMLAWGMALEQRASGMLVRAAEPPSSWSDHSDEGWEYARTHGLES